MSSLVSDFQQITLQPDKSVTQSLGMAKMISAKLGLEDIEAWIEHELSGYPDAADVPAYRSGGGILQVLNPLRGWITVTDGGVKMSFVFSMTVLEEFASQTTVHLQPPKQISVSADGLISDSAATSFVQRIAISGTTFKAIVEAVRNRLLDWSLELEKRGITGENMSFEKEEKQKAHGQTFNIQNFAGVIGDVTDSTVNVHSYTSIEHLLKEKQVPMEERKQLKTILEELETSSTETRPSIRERGEAWIVRHQELLGAGANIIRTALGIPQVV